MSSLRTRPYSPPYPMASPRREALARAGSLRGPSRARQSYALALITAVLALLGGLLPALGMISRDAWRSALAPGPAELNTLVSAVAGPAALAATAWLLVAVTVSAAAALLAAVRPVAQLRPRGRLATSWAALIAPSLLRHGIAALLGITLLAAPASAATGELNSASPPPPGGRTAVSSPISAPVTSLSAAWPGVPVIASAAPTAISGAVPGYVGEAMSGTAPVKGWIPALPGSRAEQAHARSDIGLVSASGQHRRLDDDGLMVVRRGDSLWSIAERSLGPGANEAEIAAEWPLWFTENKDVIGPDPDLLDPGQRLRPPPVPRRSATADGSARGGHR